MLVEQKNVFEHTNRNTASQNMAKWVIEKIKSKIISIPFITITRDEILKLEYSIAGVPAVVSHVSYESGTDSQKNSGLFMYIETAIVPCNYKIAQDQSESGVYTFNLSYYETDTMFVITKVTRGRSESALTIDSTHNKPFTFAMANDSKLPLLNYNTGGNAVVFSPIYKKVTDSWTDVAINGLMNSVMVWPAQYSIYTNPKMFRFKTGAINFPTTGGFGVSGVGDFIILKATKSGDIVSGLAYKL